MSLVLVATILCLFAFLIIGFGTFKTDPQIGAWAFITLLLTIALGFTTSSTGFQPPRTHPTYLMAEYSNQNT